MGEALCVIPARGGSKRVPRKNIRPIGGLPLIAHSIRAARNSGCFSRVVVSTDDEEIAGIARQHGAETPFVRGAELANDTAGTAEVVSDAIRRLGAQDVEFTCCLYPTAPLITGADLSASLAMLAASAAPGLLPVTEFDFHPLRALHLDAGGAVSFAHPQYELTRSQDLPLLLHDAGAFYWLRTRDFLSGGRIVGPGTLGWPIPRTRAIDIDTEEDFRLARILFALHDKETADAG